jgi:GDP-L-fucose synthase
MQHYSDESHVNVGCGSDLAIAELAQRVAAAVGFRGGFTYGADKPDGAPRKLLDVGRMTALGWTAPTSLDEGLRRTYEWYLEHVATTAL